MRVLVTAEQIQSSIERLAEEIGEREAGRPLTVIAVLTGSIIFLADLVRKLEMPLRVGVIQARSYTGTERGSLAVNVDMLPEVKGRDVLVRQLRRGGKEDLAQCGTRRFGPLVAPA